VFGILGLDIEKKEGIVRNAQQLKALILNIAAGRIRSSIDVFATPKQQKSAIYHSVFTALTGYSSGGCLFAFRVWISTCDL